MCLILFSYETHPPYRLVVAANRDEFHARPTRPAHFWDDQPSVFAGRDLESGGTWMGVARTGRFAAVTNYSESFDPPADVLSRGALVSGFLAGDAGTREYLERVISEGGRYRGFSLLVFDGETMGSVSNRSEGVRVLEPGVYGLANELLDSDWPKVVFGRGRLAEILQGRSENEDELVTSLFDLLGTETHFSDAELPHDDQDLASRQRVSPLFIRYPVYGTRASTIALLKDGSIRFEEQSFQPTGSPGIRVDRLIE